MTYTIIITFCLLLLVAYLFNLTAEKTRIPSVILLLLLGWGIRQVAVVFELELPDFSSILPVLASIGLVLIVLEGSLELELSRSKFGLIGKSLLGAVLPMLALAFLLSYLFQYFGGYSPKASLVNAIPLCIISSAVVIPSAINLATRDREFIIYESSFSDILGVLFFNFVLLNDSVDVFSFGHFAVQLVIMVIVSVVSTTGLWLLLNKIDHQVKFVPIILLVILIYALSELFHLPALIFILIFGLTIGNLHLFQRFKWYGQLRTDNLKDEIRKFKDLVIEGAFLIRALFFILFGYLIETSEIVNPVTLVWALGAVAAILFFRTFQLVFSGMRLSPLVFVAPRGLITILLFLSITPEFSVSFVNRSLIIQVILLSALIMTLALMATSNKGKSLPKGTSTTDDTL